MRDMCSHTLDAFAFANVPLDLFQAKFNGQRLADESGKFRVRNELTVKKLIQFVTRTWKKKKKPIDLLIDGLCQFFLFESGNSQGIYVPINSERFALHCDVPNFYRF